jgi:predicted HAD superfamily Cof-like phosphohydrolase
MITDKQQFQLHELLESFSKDGLDLNKEEDRNKIADSLTSLYKQQSDLGLVCEFMENFKQQVAPVPTIPSQQKILFRLDLILEETSEVAVACGKNVYSAFGTKLIEKGQKLQELAEKSLQNECDLLAVFDGLLDLGYVHMGMVHTFGMGDIYVEGFEEVHRSNMSKACESEEEAVDTATMYQESLEPVECTIDSSRSEEGIWLVLRKSDKKVLKSIDYSPAHLVPILLKNRTNELQDN